MERKLAYTVEELRTVMPIGRDNLYEWVKETLPHRRIGHKIVVSVWAVELWLLGVDVKAFVAELERRLGQTDVVGFLDTLDRLRVVQGGRR
jgi:hypothetical protein